MISDLKETLTAIAGKHSSKMEEISPQVFLIDVGLLMKDGTTRYQFVYLWETPNRFLGKPVIYMNSRCGEFNSNLNLYKLLKDAGGGNYCTYTITTDKRNDGTPCETVICQAAVSKENTSLELLEDVIFEVASQADYCEAVHFGGDNN